MVDETPNFTPANASIMYEIRKSCNDLILLFLAYKGAEGQQAEIFGKIDALTERITAIDSSQYKAEQDCEHFKTRCIEALTRAKNLSELGNSMTCVEEAAMWAVKIASSDKL